MTAVDPRIPTLEILAPNAWPAEEEEPLGGWMLRYTQGVSRRVNSVWPRAYDGAPALAERLRRVETWYAARGEPARYHVSPLAAPADLDATLAARGYVVDTPTVVQVAALADLPAATRAPTELETVVREVADPEWLAVYREVERQSEHVARVRRQILERIIRPAAFVTLYDGGEPAAIGRGVVEDGWLGVFSMGTRARFRRRGYGRAILRALAAWGRTRGAARAYLLVEDGNAGARALYAAAGFTTLYRYHYRQAPAG